MGGWVMCNRVLGTYPNYLSNTRYIGIGIN
jgi:hypothetical protein